MISSYQFLKSDKNLKPFLVFSHWPSALTVECWEWFWERSKAEEVKWFTDLAELLNFYRLEPVQKKTCLVWSGELSVESRGLLVYPDWQRPDMNVGLFVSGKVQKGSSMVVDCSTPSRERCSDIVAMRYHPRNVDKVVESFLGNMGELLPYLQTGEGELPKANRRMFYKRWGIDSEGLTFEGMRERLVQLISVKELVKVDTPYVEIVKRYPAIAPNLPVLLSRLKRPLKSKKLALTLQQVVKTHR